MAIRTLVAAAALFAITTPAISESHVAVDQTITIDSPSMLDDLIAKGGFGVGTTAVYVGLVLVAIIIVENGKEPVVNTVVGTN